jgi:hypothetical protein
MTRPLRRRGNITVFSLVGVGVLVVVGALVGGEAFRAYDRSHVVSATCTVLDARGSTGGSSSSHGAGTLFDQVEVRSEECGVLVLRHGVTAENKASIARELGDGDRFVFRVGAASFRWRAVLTRFRTPVIVTSYRPVG